MSVKDHQKKLRGHEAHIRGEENGCLVRCSRKGHFYRDNGLTYQKQNESSRYNLDFTSGRNKEILEGVFGE
ncbi:MAG TPA: hypothetical protein VEU33_14225, partial [Archangium sp.]|nr:hypothetical protein [Archangium sp.]